jgi:hypothetical protein
VERRGRKEGVRRGRENKGIINSKRGTVTGDSRLTLKTCSKEASGDLVFVLFIVLCIIVLNYC